jgi:hypothetical protein
MMPMEYFSMHRGAGDRCFGKIQMHKVRGLCLPDAAGASVKFQAQYRHLFYLPAAI